MAWDTDVQRLRDIFAMVAMTVIKNYKDNADLAKQAYALADAMLKARG